jgi:hypothetical protein
MKSSEPDYPSLLPVHEVREIIRIVRLGTIVQEKSSFAKYAWTLQGYLQKVLLGEPTPLIGECRELADAEVLTALESWSAQAIATAEDASPRTLPIPTSFILKWLVNKLLEALLSVST